MVSEKNEVCGCTFILDEEKLKEREKRNHSAGTLISASVGENAYFNLEGSASIHWSFFLFLI